MRVERLSDDVTLYLADCREVLPTLPVEAVAVLSDPPYGIGYVKGKGGRAPPGRLPARRKIELVHGDDELFDPALLLRFPQVILWGADHFYRRLPESGRFLAWDKLSGASLRDSFADVEFAWHNEEGPSRIFSYLWKGILKDGESGHARVHPTQKPVALMEWCIGQLKRGAKTILDPFMGSGTTGVAAVKMNRQFSGCEIDLHHFDTACRRITAELAAPRLFAERPPPPRQEMLFQPMSS